MIEPILQLKTRTTPGNQECFATRPTTSIPTDVEYAEYMKPLQVLVAVLLQDEIVEIDAVEKKNTRLHYNSKQNLINLPAIVGCLNWIAVRTRPDIAWATSRAASLITHDPDTCFIRVKHICQYLHHTLGYALRYVPIPPQSKHKLWVLGDASFAPTGEKSQQGLIVYNGITSHQRKGGNLVQWRSSRQDLIAKSRDKNESHRALLITSTEKPTFKDWGVWETGPQIAETAVFKESSVSNCAKNCNHENTSAVNRSLLFCWSAGVGECGKFSSQSVCAPGQNPPAQKTSRWQSGKLQTDRIFNPFSICFDPFSVRFRSAPVLRRDFSVAQKTSHGRSAAFRTSPEHAKTNSSGRVQTSSAFINPSSVHFDALWICFAGFVRLQ